MTRERRMGITEVCFKQGTVPAGAEGSINSCRKGSI